MLIELSSQELLFCLQFAIRCARTHQAIEFGQGDTSPRAKWEVARDILIGKLAEMAYAKFLMTKYRLGINLDFNVYPVGVYDAEDCEINGWRVDIKASRPGATWMLVELNKLEFREMDNHQTDLFFMAVTGWNRDTDRPTKKVDLVGYARREQLQKGVPGTRFFEKGQCLPGKGFELQASNFGIPFAELSSDWDGLVDLIRNTQPTRSHHGARRTSPHLQTA